MVITFNMAQTPKQKTIETYQKKDIVEVFDKERSKYLFQRYKHETEANFLKKAIKGIKKEKIKVLDVACGTGRMLPDVFSTKKEIEYHGLDTSKQMLEELKKKAKKIRKLKEIKIHLSDAAKMPFKNNEFDLVYTYHLLWHIEREDQKKVIKEMIRITKPKGLIIFDVLNNNFIWENLKKFFGKKKIEGLYKISLDEAKEFIGKDKDIKIEKFADAPIKNDFLYQIFNLINKLNKVLPSSFYHMIFLRTRK